MPETKEKSNRGRKKKDPTAVLTNRVPADKYDFLKPLVADYIKSLLSPNDKTPTPIETKRDLAPIKIDKSEIKQPAKSTSKSTTSEPTMAELLRQTYSK